MHLIYLWHSFRESVWIQKTLIYCTCFNPIVWQNLKCTWYLVLFFDLPKAFDTVNHEIYNGLKVIFLVENKLCNINGYTSSSLDITCGVPQGSILCPLLLLVYVNDRCNVHVLKVLQLILFPDDTNVFFSHTDASYLMEIVNLELKKITCSDTPGAFLWH